MATLDNDARKGLTELAASQRKNPEGQFKDGVMYLTVKQASVKFPQISYAAWRYAFASGKLEDLVVHRGTSYVEKSVAEAYANSKRVE